MISSTCGTTRIPVRQRASFKTGTIEPFAAASTRSNLCAAPEGKDDRDPGALPLSLTHQLARRDQQQEQGAEAHGVRIPRRRLLLPEDHGRVPWKSRVLPDEPVKMYADSRET